jgi:hypothetical protein
MGSLVIKETHFHPDDGSPEPKISFCFETFEGLGPFLVVKEHRGYLSADQARRLIGDLHRQNLFFSWLAGIPGLFPAVSCWRYRRQLHRIVQQESKGVVFDLPSRETPKQTRTAVLGFLGIIVGMFGVLLLWWWIDPQGFVRMAEQLQERR